MGGTGHRVDAVVDDCGGAGARDHLESGGVRDPDLSVGGGFHDRSCKGVFGPLFDRCGDSKDVVGGNVVDGMDRGKPGAALGDRPGLVECDTVEAAEVLEMDASLDEDAVAGGPAKRRNVGDGNGDHERARCGGDDHRS